MAWITKYRVRVEKRGDGSVYFYPQFRNLGFWCYMRRAPYGWASDCEVMSFTDYESAVAAIQKHKDEQAAESVVKETLINVE